MRPNRCQPSLFGVCVAGPREREQTPWAVSAGGGTLAKHALVEGAVVRAIAFVEALAFVEWRGGNEIADLGHVCRTYRVIVIEELLRNAVCSHTDQMAVQRRFFQGFQIYGFGDVTG